DRPQVGLRPDRPADPLLPGGDVAVRVIDVELEPDVVLPRLDLTLVHLLPDDRQEVALVVVLPHDLEDQLVPAFVRRDEGAAAVWVEVGEGAVESVGNGLLCRAHGVWTPILLGLLLTAAHAVDRFPAGSRHPPPGEGRRGSRSEVLSLGLSWPRTRDCRSHR